MELYHVLNRGVEKRQLFLDNRDRARFVHDMYEFNSPAAAGNAYRQFPMMDIVSPSWTPIESSEKKTRLVDIHAWVLMGNHYHLLLSELRDGGLTHFIRKLNIGYAKYFNERYKRSGTLFQGRTKKILIEQDSHFLHILNYIHLNPLDLNARTKKWRDLSISDSHGAMEYLNKYRWSSFLDYCGTKNFPSILQKEVFGDLFGNYERHIRDYLKELDAGILSGYTLE